MEKYLAGGGFVGLLGFAGYLTFRLLHVLNGQIIRVDMEVEAWKAERDELREANDRCERRVTLLIRACRKGGIEIPQEVWE